jgi:3-deoxy-manno-octulosonate cytidylyltransferase (CMP-KDO synthetase)
VTGNGQRALMFSRQPIPYPKADRLSYLRQLGLYGFTSDGLRTFTGLQPGPLERTEGVEMLRFLEHGHRVQMVLTPTCGTAVDTLEDLSVPRPLLEAAAGKSPAVPARRSCRAT